ncbi:hypothetical protein ABG79_00131 [Caloramator mitchellensis]|uniref:Thioredoxin n=1 Tax=Caloramator mitchellensis TaxID=908809 RepID=A0A0R3K316_CALMK|nr:thioredoxin family protein [Caloramator mitchellensis]KRQ87966.1 hypothetical protein ABG79_00131 [Caloramator mitchellensis]
MDFKKGVKIDEYLNQATEEQKQILTYHQEKIILSSEAVDYIKSVNKPINLVVFSENYCPDCVVTLPFITKICELNSNLDYYIFKREGNENLLNEMVGEARIPTILFLNGDFNPLSFYIEFPERLKSKFIGLNEDEKKNIINDFRNGRYYSIIEKEIIEHIKSACAN